VPWHQVFIRRLDAVAKSKRADAVHPRDDAPSQGGISYPA
jgi:hypothetical protein